jgi:hypothetical protein
MRRSYASAAAQFRLGYREERKAKKGGPEAEKCGGRGLGNDARAQSRAKRTNRRRAWRAASPPARREGRMRRGRTPFAACQACSTGSRPILGRPARRGSPTSRAGPSCPFQGPTEGRPTRSGRAEGGHLEPASSRPSLPPTGPRDLATLNRRQSDVVGRTVRWRIRPLRGYSRPLRPSSSLEICSRRVSSEIGGARGGSWIDESEGSMAAGREGEEGRGGS